MVESEQKTNASQERNHRSMSGLLAEWVGLGDQLLDFFPTIISNLYVKLLQQHNPSDQPCLRVFLCEGVSDGCMIRKNDDFFAQQVFSELFHLRIV